MLSVFILQVEKISASGVQELGTKELNYTFCPDSVLKLSQFSLSWVFDLVIQNKITGKSCNKL